MRLWACFFFVRSGSGLKIQVDVGAVACKVRKVPKFVFCVKVANYDIFFGVVKIPTLLTSGSKSIFLDYRLEIFEVYALCGRQ